MTPVMYLQSCLSNVYMQVLNDQKVTVPDVATLKDGGNVVHEKKTLFEMQYLQNYLNMKKAFQDCFRPFLIPTLNIIINQDDKQIKIIECPQKTKQNVPLWVELSQTN